MKEPVYFIWRLTTSTPWRVYSTQHHFMPSPPTHELAAWVGNDYHAALKECKRMNAARRQRPQTEEGPR